MPQLPMMKAREVVAILRRAGWIIDRQKGSHLILTRPDGTRPVVVPNHSGDVRRGTLHGILDQAGLTSDEFLNLR
jgi:predicted RNA binding protein YcfA (HicA-like mRNA interferase family)